MDQNGAGFVYLKNTFPRISDAKIKGGVFVGPQIRELTQDVKFEDQLSEVEKAASKSFNSVTINVLVYRGKVAAPIQSCKAVGCNTSLTLWRRNFLLNFSTLCI